MIPHDIEAFFESHKCFYESCDLQGIMSNHMDASLLWEQGVGSLKGRNEIRGWFSFLLSRWQVESADYELVMLRCDEKHASCVVFWTMTGHKTGELVGESGSHTLKLKVTYCLEHTEQGWKIWHAHSSEEQ